jgi:hypothetical protein
MCHKPRSPCERFAIYNKCMKISKPSKFRVGDIVVKRRSPIVILGEHMFPDGTPAYRHRDCLPQYDMESDEELWINKDMYLAQEYVDSEFTLIWRKSE